LRFAIVLHLSLKFCFPCSGKLKILDWDPLRPLYEGVDQHNPLPGLEAVEDPEGPFWMPDPHLKEPTAECPGSRQSQSIPFRFQHSEGGVHLPFRGVR